MHTAALAGKADLLNVNGGDGLLTNGSGGVPWCAVVAASIVKPLGVERESRVREFYCDLVPICTLLAAEHHVRGPYAGFSHIPRSQLEALGRSSIHVAINDL